MMRFPRLLFGSTLLVFGMAASASAISLPNLPSLPGLPGSNNCNQSAPPPRASGDTTPVNCNRIMRVKPQETFKIDPRAIQECLARGWDPPVCWRPDNGKGRGIRVGGGGGFSHGTIQMPNRPPWAVNAPHSVSSFAERFALKFPPKLGGGGGGGSDVCPTSNEDKDADYGQKVAVTSQASLQCGGAVPLTTYHMALFRNADSLLITEYGYYNYWLYQKQGAAYVLVSPPNAQLPRQLCDNLRRPTVNLPPPVGQMISFNSASGSIAIRLKSSAASDPLAPSAANQKHLIAYAGGALTVPQECDLESQFYQVPTASNIGDLVIGSLADVGCEAPPEICQAYRQPTTPVILPSCTLSLTYPSGNKCKSMMQFALLDRPNLLLPPASAPNAVPVAGMGTAMVSATTNSILQMRPAVVLHMGGGVYDLPDGGTLGMANGDRLVMKGRTIIDLNAKTIQLKQGGSIQTPGGKVKTAYGDNRTLQDPPALKPYVLQVPDSVKIMGGVFMIPSSPAGTLRLPVKTH